MMEHRGERAKHKGSLSQNKLRSTLNRPASGLRIASKSPTKHVQIAIPSQIKLPQKLQLRDRVFGKEAQVQAEAPQGSSTSAVDPRVQSKSKSMSVPVPRVPTFAPHLRVENHLIKANIAFQENPKVSRWSHPTPHQTVVSHNVANCLLASHKLAVKDISRNCAARGKSPSGDGKGESQPNSPIGKGREPQPNSSLRPGSALSWAHPPAKDILRSADVFSKASMDSVRDSWSSLSPLYEVNLLHFQEILDENGDMNGNGEAFVGHRSLLSSGRIRPKSSMARIPSSGAGRPKSAFEHSAKHAHSAGELGAKRPMSAHIGRSSEPWNEDDWEENDASDNFDLDLLVDQMAEELKEPRKRQGLSRNNSDPDDVHNMYASPIQRRADDGFDEDKATTQRRRRSDIVFDEEGSPVQRRGSSDFETARSSPAAPNSQKRNFASGARASLSSLTSPRDDGPAVQSARGPDASQLNNAAGTSPATNSMMAGLVSVRPEDGNLFQTTSTQSSDGGVPRRGGTAETRTTSSGGEKKEKKSKSGLAKEWSARKQHWRQVKEILAELSEAIRAGAVENAQDMRTFVVRYSTEEVLQENAMIGLHKALTLADSPWNERDFFSRILPTIIDRAMAMSSFFPNGRLPNMKRGVEGRLVLGRAQVAAVLANMFLCSLPSNDFSLAAVHTSHQGYQIAKIHFFINYFDRISHLASDEPKGNIEVLKTFHQTNLDWLRCRRPLIPLTISFGRAVDEEGTLQVLPSHSNIGGGLLYRGRGEEEVRLLLYPEVCISMFVCGVIDENEAVLVRGAERFSDFEGDDGFTLKFGGSWKDKATLDADGTLNSHVLLVDAYKFERSDGLEQQLEIANMDRDLNKVLIGVSEVSEARELRPVSTINWGCDRRFNGARDVRPLILWMAASVAGRELRLWLPADKQNEVLRQQLQQLSDLCGKGAVSVAQLLHGCHEASDAYRREGTLIPMLFKLLMLDPGSQDPGGSPQPSPLSTRAPYVVTSGNVEQLVSPLAPLTRERVFTTGNRIAASSSQSSRSGSSVGVPNVSDDNLSFPLAEPEEAHWQDEEEEGV